MSSTQRKGRSAEKKRSVELHELFLEVEHRDSTTLVLGTDSESFVRHYTARLFNSADVKLDVNEDDDNALARVEFELIRTQAWVAEGSALSDLGDALSSELLEVFDAIYDDNDEPKEELEPSTTGDLLHIGAIEVAAGQNVFELVRYALENILQRYGSGCMAATFYQANRESIAVVRPLKDRGFSQAVPNRHVWFVDLGRARPALKAPAR